MTRPKPNKSARGAERGLAGREEEHIFPVRVYYEDTDPGGAGRPNNRPGANDAAGSMVFGAGAPGGAGRPDNRPGAKDAAGSLVFGASEGSARGAPGGPFARTFSGFDSAR